MINQISCLHSSQPLTLHLSIDTQPVKDCIPEEVIKASKSSLLEPLHNLILKCLEEGEAPKDMRNANIITLYKNKGDFSDCNNYRGISILSIVGKLFARIILRRLQVLEERIYPESQCGFRSKKSTVDMIFSLCQLQEKCREQNLLAFIDLTKAFDLVSRDCLFKMLPLIGCPLKLLSLIRSFHDDMLSTVQLVCDISSVFGVKSGVKTRLLTCTHSLWHLLCFATEARIWIIMRRCLPPHKNRWPPLQHYSSTLQVEDKQSHSQR